MGRCIVGKLVMVTWHDAQDHPDKWVDSADAEGWGDVDCTIVSTGFLVRDTDRYITLAGDWDADDRDYGRVTKIPKAWVKSIVEVGPLIVL